MKTLENQPTATLPTAYWLLKDEDYGIHVKNEANRKVSVQVCIFIPQHRQSATGKVEFVGNNPNPIWTKVIETTRKDKATGKEVLFNPAAFKADYECAVEQAKRFIQTEKQSKTMCTGVLNDTWEQAKQFNPELIQGQS